MKLENKSKRNKIILNINYNDYNIIKYIIDYI